MHALFRDGVQAGRKRCHKGLALASFHLGNITIVQNDPAQKLHIIVLQPQHAPAGLPHLRKYFGQQIIQALALFIARTKFLCFCRQFLF